MNEPLRSAANEPATHRALPSRTGLASRRRRRGSSPHSHKFLAATATLVGIAIGALTVALAILLGQGRSAPAAKWSIWSPPDNGLAGEREIADAVAPFYRATPGVQLTVVTVQNITGPSSNGSTGPTEQLALRDPSTGQLAALPGNTAVFALCGLGPNCAISSGTPSVARMLLLRREALELALYTLKYIKGVDNVLAILPPSHPVVTAEITPKPPSPRAVAPTLDLAILFPRGSFQSYISMPLSMTLPEGIPPTVDELQTPQRAREAEIVSLLTGQTLFQQHAVQAQDGSTVLVLDPVPPQ
jgi:hypothetical protein